MNLQKLTKRIEYRKIWRSEYRTRKIKESRDYWNDYKVKKGCAICGYNKCGCALEFHHMDKTEKEQSISRMIGQRVNKEKIKEEVEKCIILCSNCHKELHDTSTRTVYT